MKNETFLAILETLARGKVCYDVVTQTHEELLSIGGVVSTAGQYGFMTIYGEDATASPPIPGMREGEDIIFRVNGAIAVPSVSLSWQNDKTHHQVDLAAGVTQAQSILLTPGWNLVSFRVNPPVGQIQTVLNSIAGKYCRILAQTGIYDCAVPDRFQTLRELEGARGYYLRLDGGASANLLVEGAPMATTTPIALQPGWNWVGYLPTTTLPVADALQSIAGAYLLVADGSGRVYDPALPAFSNLTHLEPNRGYLIYATESATLIYPEPGVMTGDAPDTEPTGLCPEVAPTPFFTLLYGGLTINGEAAPVGTRVEVLTPAGELAGCYTVHAPGQYGFLPVYGADGGAPPLPGFHEREVLQVRVNGQPAEGQPELRWSDDKQPRRVDVTATAQHRRYLPVVEH